MGLFGFLGKEEDLKDEISDGDYKNFKYLDDLIHSGKTEIVLDSNIILDDDEESTYSEGIKIDGENIIIKGNSHIIDAKGKTRIFKIDGSEVTITDVKFRNATALRIGKYSPNGGSIKLSDSVCSIDYCEFEGNNLDAEGGAIYSLNSNLKVSNSIFNNNFAGYHGAAICSEISSQYFIGKDDEIAGDEKIRVEISNCQFNDNTVENGEACGGAICNRGAVANIKDSKFNNNKCDSVGGAIYSEGIMSISNCKFTNNFALFTGGAICIYDYETQYSTLDVADSTFEANKSEESGGAIDNMGGALSVRNSRFSNNSSGSGGAVSTIEANDYYSVDIEGCDFENNAPDDVNHNQ